MLAIVIGVILIVGGLGFAVMSVLAAGMASRPTTRWENAGRPSIGVAVFLIGIAIFIWG